MMVNEKLRIFQGFFSRLSFYFVSISVSLIRDWTVNLFIARTYLICYTLFPACMVRSKYTHSTCSSSLLPAILGGLLRFSQIWVKIFPAVSVQNQCEHSRLAGPRINTRILSLLPLSGLHKVLAPDGMDLQLEANWSRSGSMLSQEENYKHRLDPLEEIECKHFADTFFLCCLQQPCKAVCFVISQALHSPAYPFALVAWNKYYHLLWTEEMAIQYNIGSYGCVCLFDGF